MAKSPLERQLEAQMKQENSWPTNKSVKESDGQGSRRRWSVKR